MSKRLTTEEFITRAKNIHGDKYDYSEAIYINSKEKVKIKCKIHGIFEPTPNNHLRGSSCPKCKYENQHSSLKLSTNEFICRSKNKFGNKFDYSQTIYTSTCNMVTIICPTHGAFETTPTSHLNSKYGCRQCGVIGSARTRKVTFHDFIQRSHIIHNNKYDYSETTEFNNTKETVTIICPTHGKFKQLVYSHLNGNGCRLCKSSKGERKIESYLLKHNITYTQQHKFEDCKYKNKLSFDFYIRDHNLCIEYDGELHYTPFGHKYTKLETHKLELRQHRDEIKNTYCINNNIELIRIPYWDFDNIETILNEYFKKGC